MGNDELERIIEAIERGFERAGLPTSSVSRFKEALDDSTEDLTKQDRLIKAIKEDMGKYNDTIKKGRKNVLDMGYQLKNLDEQLQDVEDSAEKLEVEFQRNALASQYLSAQYKKAGKEFLKATGDILVNGAIRGAKTLVTGLTSGASGVQLASDLMINAVDTTNKEVQALTSGVQGAAMVAAQFAPGYWKAVPLAIAGLSQAVGYFSEKTSDLAKFGIEVMAKEVEKTIKAFNETSSAGALFTGGMEGLRNTARDTGLTVEQLSNVIKTNSQAFAQSGLTVTEAVTRLGGISKVIKGGQIEARLMKLGYGFEEHAGLIADVMASMRKSNTLASSTDPMVAAAVEKYATNLRIIADITGEDAKARQKAANDQATQYAANRRIAQIAAETGNANLDAEIKNTLALVGPEVGKVLLQKLVTSIPGVSSGVTNDPTAITSGLDQALGPLIDRINSGNFQMKDTVEILGQFSKDFSTNTNQQFQQVGVGAMFGASSLNDMANSLTNLNSLTQLLAGPNALKAFEDAEKRKNDSNNATEELINAEREAQRLRIATEAEFTKHLGSFATVVDEIVTELRKTLAKLNLGGTGAGASGPSFMQRVGKGTAQIAGGALGIGAALLAAPETLGGSLLLGGSFAAGGYQLGGELYDQTVGEYDIGGIASGPTSGYAATLHGTEAVVPLPDNRSIPVSLKSDNSSELSMLGSKEITSAITGQNVLIRELIQTMRENNNLTSGILQQSY